MNDAELRLTIKKLYKKLKNRERIQKETERDCSLAERIQQGDREARWELAMHYRPYAVAKVERSIFRNYSQISVDDLRQESLLGLYEAAKRFDPARARFQKCADYGILDRIARFSIKNSRQVGLPYDAHTLIRKAENDDEGLNEYELRRAERIKQIETEYDIELDNDEFGGEYIYKQFVSTSSETPESQLVDKEGEQLVWRLVEQLDPVSRMIIICNRLQGMGLKETQQELHEAGLAEAEFNSRWIRTQRDIAINRLRKIMLRHPKLSECQKRYKQRKARSSNAAQ